MGTGYQKATQSVVHAHRGTMRKVKAWLESKLVRDEQDKKNGYYECMSSKNEKKNQRKCGPTAP